jgi:hypothetical protein
VDARTQRQLAILAEISRLLAAQRIRFWLRGGWAIDFMLGEITRLHSDIDLVVWLRHRQRLHRTLIEAGFKLDREMLVQTDFHRYDEMISAVFLTRRADGTIVTHGVPEWEWPAGSLSRRRLRLHGVAAAVVSPERLLWEKESYEYGTGRPPRPKDLASIHMLNAMLARQRARKSGRSAR